MNKLIKNISAIALAAGIVALPGAANAATLTTTSTATLTVTDKCSITGADVDFGTYSVNQKWSDVGAALGYFSGTAYTAGSKGFEGLKWGTLTCAAGTAYTLQIQGTGTSGTVKITINNKFGLFDPYVKKVGTTAITSTEGLGASGMGAPVNGVRKLSGTGTGAAQDILGNVVLLSAAAGSTAVVTDALGTAGSYTDTLTYTLTF